MGHIQQKGSPESKLQIYSICSVEILNILEVIAILKNCKMLNPARTYEVWPVVDWTIAVN